MLHEETQRCAIFVGSSLSVRQGKREKLLSDGWGEIQLKSVTLIIHNSEPQGAAIRTWESSSKPGILLLSLAQDALR